MTDAQGEPFTAWITKYALTLGIYKEMACRHLGKPVSAIILKKESGLVWAMYFIGEWHTSREAACVRAEEMRATEIALREKAIAKLRAVQF